MSPSDRGGKALIWMISLTAILFVVMSLSPGYLMGSGPFWQQLSGDAAQGQIGWFYFARDEWRWPLLATGNYNLPEGGNLLLSDSLPLFGVPAKILYQAFWPEGSLPPIYMGAWVGLCLLLQVLAGARLIWVLGGRSPLALISGTLILAYTPILLFRFGHATLMGHFLILLTLTGYVEGSRRELSVRYWVALCAVPIFSLWITPYLAVMTALLVVTTIADQLRRSRLSAMGAAARLGIMGAGGAALIAMSGLLSYRTLNLGDYGVYSLNLLAPFVPTPETTAGKLLYGGYPSLPGIHQWEGMAYLGTGVLLLCLAALPALKDWRFNVSKHLCLMLAVLCTLAFAISNRVGLGANEVLHIALPESLIGALSTLRGSGRFVWIAVYVVIAAAVAATLHRYGQRRGSILLAIAGLLQIIDVAPMQISLRNKSTSPAVSHIDGTTWMTLMEDHDDIFQFPSFECGGLFGRGIPGTHMDELEIHAIAARMNKPSNSAYLARYIKDCEQERIDAGTGHRRDRTLYLFRSDQTTGQWLAEHGELSHGCGYLDNVVICSGHQDLSWIDKTTE
ncbi:MAG TPA: hypothetical protein VMR06_17870 [Dokdonella sp.]|uniref:hypothetical protein n=1 Tax=Dokdonella sp. TaxID=2291710 RepID=UPI002C7B1515|nr:hypothetical protein [Dokdonella sp.]HUD43857.1 hypothetical protein [Dokdonella sp.]